MKTQKILDEEIVNLKIASLPPFPTSDEKHGGRAYTATKMKEAFDALPLFIIQRFNSLIDDIRITENGISNSIPTGIAAAHTLKNLFIDVQSGAFSTYLTALGKPLADLLNEIFERLERLEAAAAERGAEV